MKKGLTIGVGVAVIIIAIAAPALIWPRQIGTGLALEGMVSSEEEGQMEGVLVRAKGIGSSMRITVVTDSQGHYAFPRTKLGPGKYSVSIRAIGYTVRDPGQIEVSENKATRLDLKLTRTQDLASQLTNAEWLMSLPGSDEEKKEIVCVNCHMMDVIAKANYSEDEWIERLRNHNYTLASAHFQPEMSPYDDRGGPETYRKRAKLFHNIISSFSSGKPDYKTLPRPSGRATKVIITEYDLPRPEAQPHDAVMDLEGMVWYADFRDPHLGKLNPKTGEVAEYEVPVVKQNMPKGANHIEFDKEGNMWFGRQHQGGVARFDTKTQKFTYFRPPDKYYNNYVRGAHLGLNYLRNEGGKLIVWFTDNTQEVLHKLDPETGRVDSYEVFAGLPGGTELKEAKGIFVKPGHSMYDASADSLGNGYFTDLQGSSIGKVDYKTGKVTLYPTPTPKTGPKRVYMDTQDRLWYAGESGNMIGVFDTKTEKFQEWFIPTPWARPYDVYLDKNGEVWAGGMINDRIVRFNPQTNEFTDYLLPHSTNYRNAEVDNATTPVTVWVGSNHGAMIMKLEPLD